jgi:hypothetical protein
MAPISMAASTSGAFRSPTAAALAQVMRSQTALSVGQANLRFAPKATDVLQCPQCSDVPIADIGAPTKKGGRHFKPKGFRGLQDAANAVRQSLPRAGNGVRNGIFTSVAKVTQRRLQASNDLAGPGFNIPAGLLEVSCTRLCDSRNLRQFSLARLRKLAQVFLNASADTTLTRFNLSAFRLDINCTGQGGRLIFCYGT